MEKKGVVNEIRKKMVKWAIFCLYLFDSSPAQNTRVCQLRMPVPIPFA